MANVIFEGPKPPNTVPNREFEDSLARIRQQDAVEQIQRAFGGGQTPQQGIQELFQSVGGTKALLGNAGVIKQAFELLATPEPLPAPNLGSILAPQKRTAPVANLNALPQRAFTQPSIPVTTGQPSTGDIGQSFESAKLPIPRQAQAVINNFERIRQAQLKLASDNPGDERVQRQVAVNLNALEEVRGPEVKAAREQIDKVNTFNNELSKAKAKFVADAALKSKEVDSFSLSQDMNAALAARGFKNMDEVNALPKAERVKLFTDIAAANSGGDMVKSTDLFNVSIKGDDGKPIGSALVFATEEFDPNTLSKTVKLHRVDPDAFGGKNFVKASVVSSKPGDITGGNVVAKATDRRNLVDSGLIAIGGIKEDFLTLKDADINSLLSVSGGIVKLTSALKAAMSGLENTFTTKTEFSDRLFSHPVINEIVTSMDARTARFFSSYSWTLFKLAIATQEAGGKALSDKDIDRVKPQISLRSAVAFRSSLGQAEKSLRRQRALLNSQINQRNPELSVEQLENATDVVIDANGDIKSLGGVRMEKPKTRKQEFKELFK